MVMKTSAQGRHFFVPLPRKTICKWPSFVFLQYTINLALFTSPNAINDSAVHDLVRNGNHPFAVMLCSGRKDVDIPSTVDVDLLLLFHLAVSDGKSLLGSLGFLAAGNLLAFSSTHVSRVDSWRGGARGLLIIKIALACEILC